MANLNTDLLSPEQAIEATVAAYNSKDAIESIEGLEASASEIDAASSVNMNTVVIDGDSFVNQNDFIDSSSHLYQSGGYFTWANVLLKNRFNLVANNGVGGERSDQLLLRLQASIDLKPRFININIGKNDIIQGVATETIKANLLSIYNLISNAGIICIMNNLAPFGTYDATQVSDTYTINKFLMELQSTKKNFILCDMYSALVNPLTDTSRTDLLGTDNVHPTVQGAYYMGKEMAEKCDKYLPDTTLFQGGNGIVTQELLLNPYLLGTVVVAQGDRASNWTFATTSGAAILLKVPRDYGLEWQEVNMTAYGEGNLNQSVINNLEVGGTYKFLFEYEIDEGATLIDFYKAELQSKNAAGTVLYSSRGLDIGGSTTIRFTQAITSGVIETPSITITADTYRIIPYIRWKLLGKIRFGRTRIVKI